MKNILGRDYLMLFFCLVAGALAGAAAGFWTSSWYQDLGGERFSFTATSTVKLPVPPTTTLALVPVESRALKTLILPAFAASRLSPMGIVYKKLKNATADERVLSDDRMAGQAVALSSDGWFVTTAGVVDGLRLADIFIWKDGVTYQIDKGILDKMSGTVFLKIAGSGLGSTAIAHTGGLGAGAETWVESRPRELMPSLVVQPNARQDVSGASGSETASRRMYLEGESQIGDMGSAVWDPNGSLIGLIDSKSGERRRMIPAAAFSGSFASLLSSGQIRHAYLGVYALDLGAVRLENTIQNTPPSGARLMDDKKLGRSAVQKDSPAASKLKPGDVILRVERDILDGSADLGEILADYRPGASVVLRVLRDKSDLDVPLVLGTIQTGEALK